jgi:hypothetical protein
MENLKIKVKNLEVGDTFWAEIPFRVTKKTEINNIISIVSEEKNSKFQYVFDAIPDFKIKTTKMMNEVTAEEYIKINSTSNGMIDSRNAIMALKIERCQGLSPEERDVYLKYGIRRD